MLRDKTLWSIVLAAALLALVGSAREKPPGYLGMNKDLYNNMKYNWRSEFDAVAAGDSRTIYSVAPAELKNEFPGLRAGNFAFEACRFTPDYLDAVWKTIDPKSGRKIVILGLSPQSLTPVSPRGNRFVELQKVPPFDRWLSKAAPAAVDFLRPSQDELFAIFSRSAPSQIFYVDPRPDGWVPVYVVPENREKAMASFRALPDFKTKLSPEILASLEKHIKEWTDSGALVVAFRPPATPEMIEMENKGMGYDDAEISERATSAGAIWLEFDESDYHSYDGAHLDKKSSIIFSRHLAKKIRSAIKERSE